MDDKPILHSEDVFDTSYKEFQQSSLFNKLNRKYKPVPYYKKYKPLKLIALVSSYLFNVFSGLTASTLVYFFAYELTNQALIAGFITTAFIVILELSKRKTSSIFFKDLLQFRNLGKLLLCFGLLLTGLSITCSYFGSKKIVRELSVAPTIDIEALIYPLEEELIDLDGQIENARNTKWKGTTTSTSQQTIATLSEQKTVIQAEIFRMKTDTEKKNEVIINNHNQQTTVNANHFALVTLLLELLFVLTAFYLEYYDFRSYLEFSQVVKTKVDDSNITVYTTEIKEDCENKDATVNTGVITQERIVFQNITSEEAILKAIKHVKARISSAKYRLTNNIGRRETSERNIERLNTELEELESLLPDKADNSKQNGQLELTLEDN